MENYVRNSGSFSSRYYAKADFRIRQANLPYPEKVRQVIEMQKRLVPIYAAKGKKIVPWGC